MVVGVATGKAVAAACARTAWCRLNAEMMLPAARRALTTTTARTVTSVRVANQRATCTSLAICLVLWLAVCLVDVGDAGQYRHARDAGAKFWTSLGGG